MSGRQQQLYTSLTLGCTLYILCAAADIYLTRIGMDGDISLEANPFIREMMVMFGIVPGMLITKGLVLLLALVISVVAYRGIDNRSAWVYYLALTRVTRAWMRRRRRYWVAFLPLYLVALSQGVAALSWFYLIYLQR